MSYPLPWTYRRQAPPPAPAPLLPAPVLAELAQQFREQPYLGASHGEAFPVPAAPPQPATEIKRLEFEPPPWAGQAPVAPPPEPEPDPPGSMGARALAELKAKAGDDDEPPPWRPPAPSVTPLVPARIPEWPEAERRQHELELQRAQQGIEEEQPQRHPAPARREPAP